MITFRHENYICQAIEGVLMQQTDFEIELIIANDNSPDNTDSIVNDIIKTHPQGHKIKYFKHSKNIGMMRNFIFTLQQCDGKYIALCEGDDYWTDPLKLQKQFDILENNLDCVLCYTKNYNLLPGGLLKLPVEQTLALKTGFNDLIQNNYIATLTVLFRNENTGFNLPDWFKNLPIGDWPLYLWLLRNGDKAYFLDNNTAVYRYGVGVSAILRQQKIKLSKQIIEMLKKMEEDTSFQSCKTILANSIQERNISLIRNLISEDHPFSAIKFYFSIINFKNFRSVTKSYINGYIKIAKTAIKNTISFFEALKNLVSFILFDLKKIKQANFIFILPYYHTGGAERVHLNIVKALEDEKICILFTNNSSTKNFLDEFSRYSQIIEVNKILAKKNRFINKITNDILINRINKHQNLKAIFSSNTKYFYEILPRIKETIKTIDLFHAFSDQDERENDIINSIDKINYRIVINKKAKEDLETIYKNNHINLNNFQDTIVIQNGIEINNQDYKSKSSNKIKIGFVGRWSDEKRPELFLKIAKRIKVQFKNDIEFIMIGTGMKSNIDKINHAGVSFLGEITKKEELIAFYNELTFLLITSEREGFPMVIMESMACGVIPISTNVGGINEHITNRENGILINEEDENKIVDAFTETLQLLISSNEERELLSKNAFIYASENFGIEKFNKAYKNLMIENK